MICLRPPFRLATEADAPVLAVLNNEASHGSRSRLAAHGRPGADPWAVGVARQLPRVRDGLWVVADEGAGPVAGLLARPAAVEVPGPEVPAIFPPMAELEALEPAALFVQIVATLREARGQGFGTRLMRIAEDIARARDRPRLSLIVADDNDGARRLYARLGFRPLAARPMVKEGWDGAGASWLLLVRDLA